MLQVTFIAFFGRELLSSRGDLGDALLSALGRPGSAAASNFVFPLLFLVPLLALLSCQTAGSRPVRRISIGSLLLACILNNPVSQPRFYVGALAIGSIILLAGPNRAGLALFVVGAGTVAAPLLHAFRDTWAWGISS